MTEAERARAGGRTGARPPLRRTAAGAALVLALLPAVASAVLPQAYYEQARKAARYQLVVSVGSVRPSGGDAGLCPGTGVVHRILRNDADRPLRQGQAVTFAVSCLAPEVTPPLGRLWTASRVLARARWLAGYFNPAADAVQTAPGPTSPRAGTGRAAASATAAGSAPCAT